MTILKHHLIIIQRKVSQRYTPSTVTNSVNDWNAKVKLAVVQEREDWEGL